MALLQTVDDLAAQQYIEFARKLSEGGLTNQQTLVRPAQLRGFDPVGGRLVELILYPAKPNTGIWFVLSDGDLGLESRLHDGDETKKEDFQPDLLLKADIKSASYNYSGILLSDNGLRLLYPEHLLGALQAYGINNLIIGVRRFLSGKDLEKKASPLENQNHLHQ